ncbi:hypothetical protein BHM03_00059624 [Ensete ventricosum]|nr:hypothetical protein BHM03_00059624 [Ensete ventricosum]
MSLIDMADGDPAATSARPRTIGSPTWPTRRGKLAGRKYGGASGHTAGLTQVRLTPLPADACPTARTTGMVEVCDSMVRHKGSQVARRRAHIARTPIWGLGYEHHPEPNHPRPTEEATVAVSTPNRFWRMMSDPGFPSPASNSAPFVVTTEAFLGLTGQVQALAGMVQTIISYLPQLVHSMAHQSAPPVAPPQTESPAAPNRGIPPDIEAPQPQVVEARPASPTPTPARSQSRSYNPVPTELDLDTLSIDAADSLREQVRRVHQRLDEVQKEVLKSREEVGESSKDGFTFTPEIQSKPLSATFRLPALLPYDGNSDPTEHIATFRTQMALCANVSGLPDHP